MTGRLGPRTGVKKNFAQSSLFGLSLDEYTLAELLRPAGYGHSPTPLSTIHPPIHPFIDIPTHTYRYLGHREVASGSFG